MRKPFLRRMIHMQENKKRARRDLVLIFSLLLLGAALLLCLHLFSAQGTHVAIIVDNETVAEYPLAVDGEIPLLGGKNLLVIKNGEAFIGESKCPDGLCQKQGKILQRGERIVCLPHHLTVKIV